MRVTCLIGLAAALVVSTSGCDPYTYYNIDVSLQNDPASNNMVKLPNTLNQIGSCDVSVYASDSSTAIEVGVELNERDKGPLHSPCRGKETSFPELGILDYSTARTSGSLWFQVNIKDVNQNTIIQGKTDPVGVSPGKILPTVFLVASPCVDPKNPDQTHADQPNAGPCNGS
jgi:hypothetical protein